MLSRLYEGEGQLCESKCAFGQQNLITFWIEDWSMISHLMELSSTLSIVKLHCLSYIPLKIKINGNIGYRVKLWTWFRHPLDQCPRTHVIKNRYFGIIMAPITYSCRLKWKQCKLLWYLGRSLLKLMAT